MLRLRERDEDALTQLYGLLSGHVHALALRMLDSREEAEEVVQDTFVRIFERAHQYRPELGSPRAYVYTVARHEALSRLRSRGARPLRTQGDDTELVVPVETPDLTERIVAHAALARVSDRDRELLHATFFEGYTHSEVAHFTGLPVGTVKTRIRRALLSMRRRLEGTS